MSTNSVGTPVGTSVGSGGAGRRVLVVEDDPVINRSLVTRLTAVGYDVRSCFDGLHAVAECRAFAPEVVLLDVMLPGADGLTVCRAIQADTPVPVLMLTARDDEADILAGLAAGADDYLTKPFGMREMQARVAALLRRVDRAAALAAKPPAAFVFDGLAVDTGTRRVEVGGAEVHLTPTEFDLLVALANAGGQVVSRERLLADVWDWPDASGTRTVDSHIKALRAKIGARWVRTAHGVGYALAAS
ncbi:MAG: response regulator transcription factor [Nocardioides sp.]